MRKEQDYKITRTDEYKTYLSALCRLASGYVSRIRVQFADKAYEMYQDETVRRIVLAYAEEIVKLDAARLFDFRHVSEYGTDNTECLHDSCLNHAGAYGETIKMLFEIQ